MQLYNITELKQIVKKRKSYLLFCFGTSLVSQIIAAKTRKNSSEIVPTHVALIIEGCYLYESTSQPVHIKDKTIPAGVRRYMLDDFYNIEAKHNTMYDLFPIESINYDELEYNVHKPYGKDTIVDFVLRDGSDGVSKGLICSQYANKVAELLTKSCPNPAELYRKVEKIRKQDELEYDF